MPDQNLADVAAINLKGAPAGRIQVSLADIERIGLGTLNGRYMRRFRYPVFHAADLEVGHVKPLRILGEDFVVYRGESGTPQVTGPRCPHRNMSLVPSWIECDTIRCFYHGWRFDPTGQCVEQPAEKNAFCDKVRIPSYPTREYLGLIFAYFGEARRRSSRAFPPSRARMS